MHPEAAQAIIDELVNRSFDDLSEGKEAYAVRTGSRGFGVPIESSESFLGQHALLVAMDCSVSVKLCEKNYLVDFLGPKRAFLGPKRANNQVRSIFKPFIMYQFTNFVIAFLNFTHSLNLQHSQAPKNPSTNLLSVLGRKFLH